MKWVAKWISHPASDVHLKHGLDEGRKYSVFTTLKLKVSICYFVSERSK